MKYLFVLIYSLIFVSCILGQKRTSDSPVGQMTKLCPDDGVCSFEVLKNSSLKLLEDSNGKLYPEISEGDKIVLKFEYKRNEIPNTADSSYSELIYIEVEPNKMTIDLRGSNLGKAKILFARLCFCRGQTGYYKISNGNLTISKQSDSYRFNLEFKVDEVPQIITVINQSFSLN
jgi:hypothetical protein